MTTGIKSESELLANIFFPGHHPAQQPIIMLEDEFTAKSFPTNAIGLLAFSKKPTVSGYESISFGYVNNPGGGIRWLYPVNARQPIFLRLYNGSGWRAKLLAGIFKTAFSLGMERMVRSGIVHVFYKNKAPLGGLLDHCPTGDMAIFTGTVGENRKAVVAFDDHAGQSWFFKLPLTAAAVGLVKNEQQTLAQLAKFGLSKMAVPIGKPFANGLMVSNVKPPVESNSFDLQPAHFEAIEELAERTAQQARLGSLPFWDEINANLEALQHQPILNDLSPPQVNRVIEQLVALHNSLDPELVLPTVLAHGDFTPWNMYIGDRKIHVYDWELSERLPLLNDVFHFIFQAGVLVKKLPYSGIQSLIFSMKKDESMRKILGVHVGDFDFFYTLYLLRNISYYLPKYLRQRTLHRQAHWLLEAWDSALTTTGKYAESF